MRDVPTATYHLKIALHSERKKQSARRDNKVQILKLSLALPKAEMQDAILGKVAEVLNISTLIIWKGIDAMSRSYDRQYFTQQ